MNRSYIIPRLILVLLIWSFFYFAFDPILRWSVIKSFETIFEAKVEIGKIKTSFLNPSLEIYRMKVGDSHNEYKNLFEFEKLRFAVNGKQLLEKKFVIEESYIKSLNFSTARKTSCKIHISKTEMPEFVKNYLPSAKEYYVEKIEDIKSDAITEIKMDYEDLKSVKLINEINDKYEKQYREALEKADFSKYQAKLESINTRYEKIKQEKDFIKKAKELSKFKKDIDLILREYKTDMQTVSSLIRDSSSFYKDLNEARKQDLDRLMSMAKLPSVDKDTIAKALLGKDVYSGISKVLMYSKQAMKYIPDNPKKKIFEEKKQRGRIVHFPKLESYPRFLLKKASIDGVLTPDTPIEYLGFIENLTNQPSIWTFPLNVEIKGNSEKSLIHFKSQVNFADSPIKSYTNLEYKKANIDNKALGLGSSFSLTIDKAIADTTVRLKTTGGDIEGTFEAFFTQASIKPNLLSIKQQLLRDSIERSFSLVNSFSVNVLVKGKISSPSITIKTDLADIFSNAIKKAFGDEIEKARKHFEEKLDLQIKNEREKLEKIVKDNTEKLNSLVKANNDKINLWKKELEEKLKNETSKKLPKIKF